MDLKVKPTGFDCGCEARAETIGADNWWNMTIVGAAVLIVALAYGGQVTAQTKSVLKIAAAGAVVAVFANKIVKAQ
jgi:hypothetical protein